jgi:hypothetical protein
MSKYGNESLNYSFPGLFTLVTFLIYASEVVPNFYVEGAIRAGRTADVFFYEYYLFLLTNMIYWIGWFLKKRKDSPVLIKRIMEHPFLYFASLSCCLMLVFGVKELKQTSSYRATSWIVNGYAKEYKNAWEDRLALLNDPELEEVYFDRINLYQELVFYADISEDAGGWLNLKCAEYYGKDAVALKKNSALY